MLGAALVWLLAAAARADVTEDRLKNGYEEVTLLGWNDSCSIGMRHFRFPPGVEGYQPDPVWGRIGSVSLEADAAAPTEDWLFQVKEGSLWDRSQVNATLDAMARDGYNRHGYRERIRPEPVSPGRGLDTLKTTKSLRINYAISLPTAPYTLAQIDYSPLGNCALLLYEKPGRPPNVFRFQLARVPLEVRRKRAQAHLTDALLLYKKDSDLYGALEESEVAASMDPHLAEARYDYALLLSANGRFDEALRELHAAVLLDPKYVKSAKAAPEFEDLRAQPRFKEALETPQGVMPLQPL